MSEPFIGEIRIFGFNFAPRGWAFCAGQLLAISQNTALFSLLGTTYGGDGQTTFALPDLRGRTPVHLGAGPGLSNITLGEKGGAENVTMTVANMPAHTHTVNASPNEGETGSPANAFPSATTEDVYSSTGGTTMNPAVVGNAGGGQPVPIRSPYLGMNFCIALVGIFPPRD
jgi:microcystin-dependent protein